MNVRGWIHRVARAIARTNDRVRSQFVHPLCNRVSWSASHVEPLCHPFDRYRAKSAGSPAIRCIQ